MPSRKRSNSPKPVLCLLPDSTTTHSVTIKLTRAQWNELDSWSDYFRSRYPSARIEDCARFFLLAQLTRGWGAINSVEELMETWLGSRLFKRTKCTLHEFVNRMILDEVEFTEDHTKQRGLSKLLAS